MHTGGCQCGAIRFEAVGEPRFISNFHCLSCRKATGAPFSSWVGFREEQTRWSKGRPTLHASSPGAQRGFCAKCGTPLSYASTQWPGELHFLVGVFDDPQDYAPRTEAFPEDALLGRRV